jgi:hypothetical protein
MYGKHSSSEKWEKTKRYTFDHPPGGLNQYILLLFKSMYDTKQAARRWHTCISDWMERNGYPAVNSEKTIFMKRQGTEIIIHGLFVDNMMHIPTCDKLHDEFLTLYQKDLEITGGGLM